MYHLVCILHRVSTWRTRGCNEKHGTNLWHTLIYVANSGLHALQHEFESRQFEETNWKSLCNSAILKRNQ